MNVKAPRGPDSKRSGWGNLLRRSSSGYAGRVFAEPCEAKNTISPCGKPHGFLAKKGQKKCPETSFLDAGCGSGILAIAAAKLGFKPVAAIDNDPSAVKAAKTNCVRNNVADKVVCRTADLLRFRSARKYSVIAANLFANVLIRSAGNLASLLDRKAHCRLILAGILEKQYGRVAKAFLKLRLRETKKIKSQGWVTAVFE